MTTLDRLKFCSTGLGSDIRNDVANKITKMGGVHEVNLLSDVKFLIVGARDTDKYKFCIRKRSDIKFIDSNDVMKMFEKWLNNEVINPYDYYLPIFKNFKICLSRLKIDKYLSQYFQTDDLETIQKLIMKVVSSNGGEISTSLSVGNSCIVTNDLNGKKYEMAKTWNIPVIHPVWVIFSLKRNAAYEFKQFQYNDNDESQFESNFEEIYNELNKKRSRTTFESDILENDQDQTKKELTIKKKDPKVWESIMSGSIANITHNKVNEWDDNLLDAEHDETDIKKPIAFSKIPNISTSSILNPPKIKTNESHLFKDKKFYLKFFNSKQSNIIKKVITSHNGILLEEEQPEIDYIIIPSDFDVTHIPSHFHDYLILTEWFIERSLHYQAIKIDQWGKPFYKSLQKNHKFVNSLPEGGLNVSITGFQGIELLHITKMIQTLMKVTDDLGKSSFKLSNALNKTTDILILNIDLIKLSKKNSYLISKNPSLFVQEYDEHNISSASLHSTRSKMKFAKSNSIPIVTISFLFEFFFRSLGDDETININLKDWCLYCPREAKMNPRIFKLIVSYDQQDLDTKQIGLKKNNDAIEPNEEFSNTDSFPKLPSPIRNKRQNNNLRLVGRAKSSHLDTNQDSYRNAPDFTNDQENLELDELHDGDLRTTQISYENNENSNHVQQENVKRRTTRGVYKELLGLRDDID